ncbi:unnamed protein product [Polarella glacialis]|uniref:EF-hand domain-containing protein n=1 Tax=Polarella glacialis TaxID=89957 RepID=A0A813HW30_POLGL|nr:unnamed protein product [Polarella glacialis]
MGNVLAVCQNSKDPVDVSSEVHGEPLGYEVKEGPGLRSCLLDQDDIEWSLEPGTSMTVMMLGMSGSGKSALGNLLAGVEAFASSDDSASVTNLDSVMKHTAEDDSLMLLDTIGLGDTEISQEKVVAHIQDVALSAPNGIDVLLLVLRNARITDDTIARITYATEYLWGRQCLLNLYVVITFAAPKYLISKAEAHTWINRQVEINWRFKHIFSLVGNNPNRFIFVDNPDAESMEPGWEQRRAASRRAVMRALCLHPRDVIPPFTSSIMKRARGMMQAENKDLLDMAKELHWLSLKRPSAKRLTQSIIARLPGAAVRILGLGKKGKREGKVSPEADGLEMDGELKEWDPKTGGWTVVCEDGQSRSIKMEHLQLLTSKDLNSKTYLEQFSEELEASRAAQVKKAKEAKKKAQLAMAEKVKVLKADRQFGEHVARVQAKATTEFTANATRRSNSVVTEEAAGKIVSQMMTTGRKGSNQSSGSSRRDGTKAPMRRSSSLESIGEKDVTKTSASTGPTGRQRSKEKQTAVDAQAIESLKTGPFRKQMSTMSTMSADSTNGQILPKLTSKRASAQSASNDSDSSDPDMITEEKLDRIIARVQSKIDDVWNSTPGEVFKNLGGPRGSSEISPFAFNMFMRSAEQGITPIQVGCLWRRADTNCDGGLSLPEFQSLLKPRS